ncbi:MAG: hypothetical protein LAP85_27635 [Acidobacteriia bacterium]|nr:hypothetical protein [Terriglobia bacterium]
MKNALTSELPANQTARMESETPCALLAQLEFRHEGVVLMRQVAQFAALDWVIYWLLLTIIPLGLLEIDIPRSRLIAAWNPGRTSKAQGGYLRT